MKRYNPKLNVELKISEKQNNYTFYIKFEIFLIMESFKEIKIKYETFNCNGINVGFIRWINRANK